MKEYQKESTSVKCGAPGRLVTDEVTEETKGCTVKVINAKRLMKVAEHGLAAMVYEVGLEAMYQLFEKDVEEIVGPKGKHNKNRDAYRHGTETTKVVLNDKKISVKKPRVRSNGHDVQLPSLPYFQNEDALDRTIVTRLLCGISTRKYNRTATTDGDDSVCTSKSEVSRRYNAELKRLMDDFFKRRFEKDFPVVMIDGMEKGGMTIIAALGVDNDGKKQILGLVEGATENSDATKALLSDLVERGLRPDVPRMFVLDGSKALKKAVKGMFGKKAQIQRCQVHKKRNVLSHLPLSEQANVGMAISRAYMECDYDKALSQLNQIADNLDNRYPSAAASMREGLEETLTVHRLNVPGLLRNTLSSTNAMESANSVAASVVRRISKWRDGEMVLRHMAAGFLEAERGFRRVQGYRQISVLVSALYDATVCVSSDATHDEAV